MKGLNGKSEVDSLFILTDKYIGSTRYSWKGIKKTLYFTVVLEKSGHYKIFFASLSDIADKLFFLRIVSLPGIIFIFTLSLILALLGKRNFLLLDEVKKRFQDLSLLLNNSGQGFLSFNSQFVIQGEYSRQCVDFFQGEIKGKSILKVLFTQEDPKFLRDSFDLIFKDSEFLESIEELLPDEIKNQNRILKIQYKMIERDEKTENKIMLILTDVTQEKMLAEQISEEEDLNRLIVNASKNKEAFIGFIKETQELFEWIDKELSLNPKSVELKKLFRCFHTIKGNSGIYHMVKIVDETHELEDALGKILKENREITTDILKQLKQKTFHIKDLWDQYLEQIKSFISEEEMENREVTFRITLDQFTHFQSCLEGKIFPEFKNEVNGALKVLQRESIKPIHQRYLGLISDLAKRLNKSIEFIFEGENMKVPMKKLEGFFSVLVHLVRNAVDHGIEPPQHRLASGKSETGQIIFSASIQSDIFYLNIKDDGQGIDPEKVKEISLKKKIVETSFFEKASREKVIRLIFSPGFSSKEEVSDISGRGVGMDAVLAEVENLGGKISVRSTPGKGCDFEIRIPI